MSKPVTLVVDTNLFIEFRKLEELPWNELFEADRVDILVVRPVQKEIDRQKGQARGRVQKQARAAAARFTKILDGTTGHQVIRDAEPHVALKLSLQAKPDENHRETLDYEENDDRIVGIASTLASSLPNADVLVFSDDTGVIASADAIALPRKRVPPKWRRPPEADEHEREIARLKREIADRDNAAPQLVLRCLGEDDESIDRIEAVGPVWEPFEDGDLDRLIASLEHEFPKVTASDLQIGAVNALVMSQLGIGRGTVDAEDIERYQRRYADWIVECRARFAELADLASKVAEGAPDVIIELANTGRRAAENLRIDIEARGAFKFEDPDRLDDDEELPALPPPPQRPIPKKNALRHILADLGDISQYQHPALRAFDLSVIDPVETHRDPEGFYYHPRRGQGAVDRYTLQCQRFRHAIEPRRFRELLRWNDKDEPIAGAVSVTVHADELTAPVKRTFAVRLTGRKTKPWDLADKLIKNLKVG